MQTVDRSRFPYPRHGSGSLWQAVADRLPTDSLRFGSGVAEVDLQAHRVLLDDGRTLKYTHMISSIPLTEMLGFTAHAELATQLLHSSVEVLGFGFDGAIPEALSGRSWIYHADRDVPFHRATVLSNYSPEMAGAGRWSILLECGTSTHRPLDQNRIVKQCLDVLRRWGAVDPVSVWRRRLHHGYPAPFRDRDTLLSSIIGHFEDFHVRARGRFGGWRYESCNQDHAFMQGVQAVDAIAHGAAEDVYWPNRPLTSLTKTTLH